MCKTHCIDSGGCDTAIKHRPEFAGGRQKHCVSHPSLPLLPLPSHSGSPGPATPMPVVDLADEGINDAPNSCTVADFSDYLIDPALRKEADWSLTSELSIRNFNLTLAKLNAGPLVPASLSPDPLRTSDDPNCKPLLMAEEHRKQLTTASQPPKTLQRQPKITTQMNSTWVAEYKFSAVELSAKAKHDKEQLAGELAAKRCVDLVYWDQVCVSCHDLLIRLFVVQDYSPPTIIALQGTNDDDSDIPHWPDWALTHVPALLPSLGNDITSVEWLNPSLII